MFCTAALFVKYCYTTVSCYNVWANSCCLGCSPLGERSLWKGTIVWFPLPVKQPWKIWVYESYDSVCTGVITTTKQSITEPFLGLALLTLSWDKNWDSHSLVNGYPSFYPRIALVAPSPDGKEAITCNNNEQCFWCHIALERHKIKREIQNYYFVNWWTMPQPFGTTVYVIFICRGWKRTWINSNKAASSDAPNSKNWWTAEEQE